VIASMVGRDVNTLFPPGGRQAGPVVLEVRNLATAGTSRGGCTLSFQARQGEILGIAGLMGAGRTELLSTIFGRTPARVPGEILIDGRPVTIRRPADAIAHGIAFVTEDRKRSGLLLDQSIVRNITLPSLRRISGGVFTDDVRELAAAIPLYDSMRVKAHVGAKQEIYAEIDKLARAGMAIIMVSSELTEILGLADRVLVMRDGRFSGEFSREQANAHDVMACATGLSSSQPSAGARRET